MHKGFFCRPAAIHSRRPAILTHLKRDFHPVKSVRIEMPFGLQSRCQPAWGLCTGCSYKEQLATKQIPMPRCAAWEKPSNSEPLSGAMLVSILVLFAIRGVAHLPCVLSLLSSGEIRACCDALPPWWEIPMGSLFSHSTGFSYS